MTWKALLAKNASKNEYKVEKIDKLYRVTCGTFGRSYPADGIDYKAAVEKISAETLLEHGNLGRIDQEFEGTEFVPEVPVVKEVVKKATVKKTAKKKAVKKTAKKTAKKKAVKKTAKK